MWSVTFSLSRLWFVLCNLIIGGSSWGTCNLFRVSWLFSCSASGVAQWLLLRKTNANGGPKCVACLAWFHTLSMCTSPPSRWLLSTGGPDGTCPAQDHNRKLHSVALNYPCPIRWLSAVSHNRTKCRKSGTRELNYFCLWYPCRFTIHLSDPRWRTDPHGSQGSHHRRLQYRWWVLPGLPQCLLGGPPHDIFTLSGGYCRVSDSAS
jgi:hypothetical protein